MGKISQMNGIADLGNAFSTTSSSGSTFGNVIGAVTGFLGNNPGVVTTATNFINQATGTNIQYQPAVQYQQQQQKSDNMMLYVGLGAAALLTIYLISQNKK